MNKHTKANITVADWGLVTDFERLGRLRHEFHKLSDLVKRVAELNEGHGHLDRVQDHIWEAHYLLSLEGGCCDPGMNETPKP